MENDMANMENDMANMGLLNDVISKLLFGIDINEFLWFPYNMFLSRDTLKKLVEKLEVHVSKNCFYCSNCQFCKEMKIRRDELKRMGFWSYNKNVKYWNVYDPLYNRENEKFYILPLNSNFKNGVLDFHNI